jgi:hypothetical protein
VSPHRRHLGTTAEAWRATGRDDETAAREEGVSHVKALSWLQSYGYATLVLLSAAAGALLGVQTEVPESVPDFALQAEAIYRLEVCLAGFLGFYLICSLFVSALNGHGLTHLGPGGLRVQRIVNQKQQSVILGQERSIGALRQAVKRSAFAIQAGLTGISQENRELRKRVDDLSSRVRRIEKGENRRDPE